MLDATSYFRKLDIMAWRNVESVKTTNIVISGISGVFPKSNNIEEFKKNLFSANDMISEHNRWDSCKYRITYLRDEQMEMLYHIYLL